MLPPIASNFVAGESPSAALSHVDDLNDRDVAGILNLLGEHYDDPANARADTQAYVDLVRMIEARGVDACISVKPSQLGLDVSADLFEENLGRVVDAADSFVWIDMEDHTTTGATLDAFETYALETDGNVGVCIQANLRRTATDIQRLADLPGKVRLVKGAYDEPGDISHEHSDAVDGAYEDLLTYAFREFDDGIAVGSHDPAMIAHARSLHEEHATPYEVQMLMGVREEAQFDLASDGVPVYQYVPYGGKWLSYFYRRIRERKQNLAFVARAIVGD